MLASTSITFLAGPISNITDRAAQSAQDLSIYRSAVLLHDPSAPTRNLDAFRHLLENDRDDEAKADDEATAKDPATEQ